MFRYKKSIPVSYERQGYIYFSSLLYRELPEGAQRKILNLCLETGGEYYQALFEFVTTDAGAQAVCLRHHLSPSVLGGRMIYRTFYDCRFLPIDMPEERRIQIASDEAARSIAEYIRDKITMEYDPRTNTVRGTIEI